MNRTTGLMLAAAVFLTGACTDQRDVGLKRVCHGQRLKAFSAACTCAVSGAGTGNSPLSTACV